MILQQIQPQLKKGRATKRGRKAKAKPVRQSRKAEIMYTKELLAITELCIAEGNNILERLKADKRFVGDDMGVNGSNWQRLTQGTVDMLYLKIDGISGAIAGRVVQAQKEAVDNQIADMVEMMTTVDIRAIMTGENLTDVVNDAISANVSLIESIPKKYFDKLETIVNTGFQDGWTYNQIQDEIYKVGHSTKARARFIARDQIGKMNGQFNKARQESLGIDSYTWDTSGDERVRDKHARMDGKTVRWDDPPSFGHPGQDFQCRCTPIPNLDHLLS